MDKQDLINRIEAVLFVSGDPIPLKDLSAYFGISPKDLRELLSEAGERYERDGRGIMPFVTEEYVQLVSNRAYGEEVEGVLNPIRRKSVSQSLMETLAVIAYRQPITKGEIEGIRGVRCDYAVGQLLRLNLITDAGKKNVIGRPTLWRTTDYFLRCFGLHSVQDLPEYDRFAESVQPDLFSSLPSDEAAEC